MRQMTDTPKGPSNNGRQASPMAIVFAVVVLAVLLYAIYKLPIGKDNPEPTNAAATTANALASTEASPTPVRHEPQTGDVVYDTDLIAPSKTGGYHKFAHLEIRLVQYNEFSGNWAGRARVTCPSTTGAEAGITPVYCPNGWHYMLTYRVPCPCIRTKCGASWHAGFLELAPLLYLDRKVEVSEVTSVDIE